MVSSYTAIKRFIDKEISVWGEEYVDDLLNRGYEPVLIENKGWMWMLVKSAKVT